MDNDSPFNLCGLCDPNSELNAEIAERKLAAQRLALGTAIAALKTYGAIVNGANAYAEEITTLTELRSILYTRGPLT
jgi:hypothetical protein